MYLLKRFIASVLTLFLMVLGGTPVEGQSPKPAPSSQGPPGEVIVPTPRKPRGKLKPPVIQPDTGPAPAPASRNQSTAILIPAGTGFPARLTERLTSKTAEAGDRFEALLDRDLMADGRVVVPKGSRLIGVVEEAEKGGRVKGRASLTVVLQELQVGASRHELTTNSVTIEAASSKKKDARTVGVATGVGALLGAVFGGKSGAAIGATVGGGAGGAKVLTSRGQPAILEKEQLLTFRLEEDTTIQLEAP